MRTVLSLLLAVGPGACSFVDLQDVPATPQRPTLSSDTATTAKGTLEIEAGVAVDPTDAFDSPLQLKVGAAEATELFLAWSPYRWVERSGPDGRGQGNLFIGVRNRFLEETESRPSAAFQLQTKIPTASEREGLGSGALDFLGAGIVTKDLGGFLTTGFYQIGILGEPDGGDTDLEHDVAIASGTPLVNGLGAFAEVAGTFIRERDTSSVFTTLGLAYAIARDVVADAGVVVGLSDDAPDFRVVAGVTINFGHLFPGERGAASGASARAR